MTPISLCHSLKTDEMNDTVNMRSTILYIQLHVYTVDDFEEQSLNSSPAFLLCVLETYLSFTQDVLLHDEIKEILLYKVVQYKNDWSVFKIYAVSQSIAIKVTYKTYK